MKDAYAAVVKAVGEHQHNEDKIFECCSSALQDLETRVKVLDDQLEANKLGGPLLEGQQRGKRAVKRTFDAPLRRGADWEKSADRIEKMDHEATLLR